MTSFFLALVFPVAVTAPNILPNEEVVFFPVSAHFDASAQVWRIPIHGWIYQKPADSFKERLGLLLLRSLVKVDEATAKTELFRRRGSLFLVDNKVGKLLTIRLAGRDFALEPSSADGHFSRELTMTPQQAGTLRPCLSGGAAHWLAFQAVMPPGDARVIKGQVQLVPEIGLTIISDMDDTIRDAHATDRRRVLADTFSKELVPVTGMTDIYRCWAKQGASFHYVSFTPWQLYGPYAAFCRENGFPAGSFAMKSFRLKDRSAMQLLGAPDEFKLQAIESLLTVFPRRQFILVGDSGARDPEIYGELSRRHPTQVVRVYLRNVNGETTGSTRMHETFRSVPRCRWQLFSQPAEIPALPAIAPPTTP